MAVILLISDVVNYVGKMLLGVCMCELKVFCDHLVEGRYQ